MALVYMSVVVAVECPYSFTEHHNQHGFGEVRLFTFSLHVFEAFSLCVFAFNCHLNVIPIADSLTRPTIDRMRKLSARVNVFQWLFYSLIGVTGLPRSCWTLLPDPHDDGGDTSELESDREIWRAVKRLHLQKGFATAWEFEPYGWLKLGGPTRLPNYVVGDLFGLPSCTGSRGTPGRDCPQLVGRNSGHCDDVDHPCLLHGRYLGKDLETSADTGVAVHLRAHEHGFDTLHHPGSFGCCRQTTLEPLRPFGWLDVGSFEKNIDKWRSVAGISNALIKWWICGCSIAMFNYRRVTIFVLFYV